MLGCKIIYVTRMYCEIDNHGCQHRWKNLNWILYEISGIKDCQISIWCNLLSPWNRCVLIQRGIIENRLDLESVIIEVGYHAKKQSNENDSSQYSVECNKFYVEYSTCDSRQGLIFLVVKCQYVYLVLLMRNLKRVKSCVQAWTRKYNRLKSMR